jgi:hypothetical protein
MTTEEILILQDNHVFINFILLLYLDILFRFFRLKNLDVQKDTIRIM